MLTPRCMLCRKKVEALTEHGLCEECEQKFDFNQGEPYEVSEDEYTPKNQLKRVLVSCGCGIGLILFFFLAIPFLMSVFGILPD